MESGKERLAGSSGLLGPLGCVLLDTFLFDWEGKLSEKKGIQAAENSRISRLLRVLA
jgi:hypothetical protein